MQEILQNMLKEQIKGQLNKQIAQKIGVNDSQAQDMIENSLPYLLGGLSKNTQSKEGADSLLEALQSGKHDDLDTEALINDPEAGEGEGILKHVLGSKEETIEKAIAEQSKTDPAQAKKTMMVMAPMIMAALSKVVKSDKLSGDKLSEVVTDVSKNKDFGGAGMKLVMQFLDQDGDGDIKDDLFRIGKQWLGSKF